MTRRSWVDVTRPVEPGMVVYEGDPPVRVTPVLALDRGDAANVAVLRLGTHTGTHVDAPRHLLPDGRPVDRLSLDLLVGPARVLACPPGPITPAVVARARARRLILKTESVVGAARRGAGPRRRGLTLAAARSLVRAGTALVGVDSLSVEASGARRLPVHRCLLEAGVVIVEGLDLSSIEPGTYDFCCLPLAIRDGDGAPARALLRRR